MNRIRGVRNVNFLVINSFIVALNEQGSYELTILIASASNLTFYIVCLYFKYILWTMARYMVFEKLLLLIAKLCTIKDVYEYISKCI